MNEEFNPRCLRCRRVLSNAYVVMSHLSIQVTGDCSKCGTQVTAAHDSWSPDDFHLDLHGNVLGQMELPLGV